MSTKKQKHQNQPDKQFGFGIHPRSVNMEDDALPVSIHCLRGTCSWRFHMFIMFLLNVMSSLYQLQCNFSIHSIVSEHKFLETLQAAEHRKEGLILWSSLWYLSQARKQTWKLFFDLLMRMLWHVVMEPCEIGTPHLKTLILTAQICGRIFHQIWKRILLSPLSAEAEPLVQSPCVSKERNLNKQRQQRHGKAKETAET